MYRDEKKQKLIRIRPKMVLQLYQIEEGIVSDSQFVSINNGSSRFLYGEKHFSSTPN